MVPSRKSKSNSLLNDIKKVLSAHIKQDCHLAVALSGGVDSVVMLDLLVALSNQMQFTLSAAHINHGISCNAVLWSQFCSDLCHAYRVPITVTTLNISKESGVSLEAAARDGRYQVFDRLTADYVVLAQHLDDQVETMVLQLLRGAGPKGLGAMPTLRKQVSDTAPQIIRPLLDVTRHRIEAYALQNDLKWVTDESNHDVAFDRNFLRHKIFPLLEKRYPAYQKTLLRSRQHFAEASALLDELAEVDAKNCVIADKLQISKLCELSVMRAKNLLRYIFSQQGVTLPSTVKLTDILQQLISARSDTKLRISFGSVEVRCYKGEVYVQPRNIPSEQGWQVLWQGEKKLLVKNLNGWMHFTQAENDGIDMKKLMIGPVIIRTRMGGEKFRPNCKRPRRSLKKLLQEALIPPWKRQILPLLFCGEQLVWVPGIGVDCEFQIKLGDSGLVPIWELNK